MLAVGIVVDDSIVVVENIERWMGKGLPAREATIKAMDEITGPVIGITLVLVAVFIPTAFIPGLTGQFFRQFALTIAVAAFFSATNALTMAPARAVAWIKPHGEGHDTKEALPRVGVAVLFGVCVVLPARVRSSAARWSGLLEKIELAQERGRRRCGRDDRRASCSACPGRSPAGSLSPLVNRGLGWFFGLFNKAFDVFADGYTRVVGVALRLSVDRAGGVCRPARADGVRLHHLADRLHSRAGPGLRAGERRPAGRGLGAADAGSRSTSSWRSRSKTPGVESAMAVSRLLGRVCLRLVELGHDLRHPQRVRRTQDAAKRRPPRSSSGSTRILREGARAAGPSVFGAPPVPGLGQSGGFQLQIEDRTGMGMQALQEATETIVAKANAQPGLARVFTTFRADAPQLYLDIDRDAVKQMGVALNDVFTTLNANMGSVYINQFNEFGRIWQVNVQAEGDFRAERRQPEAAAGPQPRGPDGAARRR